MEDWDYKTIPNSQELLNALAIDDPFEYARLVLNNEMADFFASLHFSVEKLRLQNRAIDLTSKIKDNSNELPFIKIYTFLFFD